MAENNNLPVPYSAAQDPNSFELLRIWIANKDQRVSLRSSVWKDPAAWGIMLSDLIQHIANSYEQSDGLDRMKVVQRIKEDLAAEISTPTDQPRRK